MNSIPPAWFYLLYTERSVVADTANVMAERVMANDRTNMMGGLG